MKLAFLEDSNVLEFINDYTHMGGQGRGGMGVFLSPFSFALQEKEK